MRKMMAVGLLALLGAAPAYANDIVSTFTIPSQVTQWMVVPTYNLLDPSVGTINYVDLSISASMYGTIGFQNTDSASGNAAAVMSGSIAVYDTMRQFVNAFTFSSIAAAQYLPYYNGQPYYSDNTSFINTSLTSYGSMDILLTDPTALSYFSGSGTADLYMFGSDLSNVATTLAGQTNLNDLLGATLTLTINYTPVGGAPGAPVGATVPEPREVLVFGVALAGLALAQRRRQRLA